MKSPTLSMTSYICSIFGTIVISASTAFSCSTVIEWNEVLSSILKNSTANQNPGYASRSMAMMNVGLYDGFSSSSSTTTSSTFYNYDTNFHGAYNNSTSEVAASQAAYRVLSSLYSDQQSVLDTFRAGNLANYGGADISVGVALGNEIGNKILANRVNDGWNNTTPYNYSSGAGAFQPDPLNPSVPVWGPNWDEVTTFAISSPDGFVPGAPASITSAAYTNSYNEVKSLGSANSTTRTAEQTEIGLFWAYDREGMGTPMALFNQAMRNISSAQGNTVQQDAEMFARASVAMADAGITAWKSKFDNELWRAVTAIHQGDNDGNSDTVGDVNWIALGAPDGQGDKIGFTPQFPTYVSGHATFGAAFFKSLEEFYGTDDISFDLISEELEIIIADPTLEAEYGLMLEDAERNFTSLSEAMMENGRSRVYLGIHFDFDDVVGQEVGMNIASHIHENNFVAAYNVPEPSSSILILSGLGCLFFRRMR